MVFAIVSGKRVEATLKLIGTCPLCEQAVFTKCGEVNVWHWAHYKNDSCDNWYEPETQWHKNWKLVFGEEHSEIIIIRDGIKHIADIQTKDKVIIELQNSPIQKPIIRSRENFYGERMIWVVNGINFKKNFSIDSRRASSLKDDDEYYRLHNPLSKQYDIVNNHGSKVELRFSWNWCRKSWSDVKRNVFIDFGDGDLFWVKDGMGRSCGSGRHISKERFIKKYGGDLDLLPTIIDSPNRK